MKLYTIIHNICKVLVAIPLSILAIAVLAIVGFFYFVFAPVNIFCLLATSDTKDDFLEWMKELYVILPCELARYLFDSIIH